MAADDPEVADLAGEMLELSDLLNTALDKGVIVHGDVTLAVADIDLVKLNVGLLLAALETVESRSARPIDTRSTLADVFGPPRLAPATPDARRPRLQAHRTRNPHQPQRAPNPNRKRP